MKLKTMILLAMALGCGLVAMVGVQQVLAERQQKGGNKVSVLVARMEIEAGAEITDTNVVFEDRPIENVPQEAVTSVEQYAKRATTVRLFPGELVLQAKLGEPGVLGVAAQIPKGMRVVAVPVNATSSISGLVAAGNKVDIVLTYAIHKAGVQYKKSKTILTNIEIFSVDKVRHNDSPDAAKQSAKPENVSLLVTPQQAQTLSFATQKGQLQLTLRSTSDDVMVETTDIDDEAFEGTDSEEGVNLAEEGEPAPKKPSNSLTSGTEQDKLKAFLNPNAPPLSMNPDPTAELPPAPQPANEVWAITIWDGEEKRIEALEIVPPKTEPAAVEPPLPEPTATAQPVKSGGPDVAGWLKRLISEPRVKKPAPETTPEEANTPKPESEPKPETKPEPELSTETQEPRDESNAG
jgi:pilus assembly protein CpaB